MVEKGSAHTQSQRNQQHILQLLDQLAIRQQYHHHFLRLLQPKLDFNPEAPKSDLNRSPIS